MTDGYENREQMVRDHWKRYGFHWDVKKMGPRLNIPIRHKVYPFMPRDFETATLETAEIVEDKLTFAFERGTLDGRPAYRITCEDVVVEEGPL